jgi:hypothetical protein
VRFQLSRLAGAISGRCESGVKGQEPVRPILTTLSVRAPDRGATRWMMLGKTGGNRVEKSVDPLLKSGAQAVEIAGMFRWIAN